MQVALITPNSPDINKGGVETFSALMGKNFPGLKVYSSSKQDEVKILPIMGEIQKSWNLGRRLFTEGILFENDAIICNGFSALYFLYKQPSSKIILVQHGNYAGYIRSSYATKPFLKIYSLLTWGLVESFCAKRAFNIVSVSQNVKRDLRKFYRIDSRVIHNGIDTNLFSLIDKKSAREAIHLNGFEKVILFVGRFNHPKGSDLVEKMARSFPTWCFVCVTPKSEQIVDIPNIKMFFDVAHVDMPLFYSASDLLFAPSRFEGCSYAILEALSCDTPVISREVGIFENKALIRDGIVLFKSDIGADDFAKLVEKVDHEPGSLRKLAISEFNISQQISNYENLIREIL